VPKGVQLTHRNILSDVKATSQSIPVIPGDVFLSFLPLSHMLERTAGYYMPLLLGGSIAYSESYKKLPKNFKEVKPTVVIAVPRFFEKTSNSIWDIVNTGPLWRKKLFLMALREKGGFLSHFFAQHVVFRKIRRQLGGRIRVFISGELVWTQSQHTFLKK